MRSLGIHVGHDASIAIVEDEKILFAASEERLTEYKKMTGFPARTLLYACNELGIGVKDFDRVVYSSKSNFFFRPTKPYVAEDPRKLFPDAEFQDHHYCHALTAYALSGFDECVVMTLDGGGDDVWATIYDAKDGKLTLIDENRFTHYPFGLFYNHVTSVCGYTPNRHEGKIMGLAAHGTPSDMFDGLFHVEGTQIKSTGKKTGQFNVENVVIKALENRFVKPLEVVDIAASGQKIFEDVVLEWVTVNAKGKKLAVAGGCFANVLANMKIAKVVEKLFVAPPMFDDGLAIGAALSVYEKVHPVRVKDMYLGFSSPVNEENRMAPSEVAAKIKDGEIVGLFQGRMEFGPRALGNRTILADARDRSINTTLNKRLNRTEFMPFGPVILEEYAWEILEDYETGIDNAPFMTCCWKVKENWKDRIPAVVHIDGTVRPQVISRDVNPYYYDIVEEYRKLTGIPVLINTSFNGHESPILADRIEAEWSKALGYVDVLVEN